MSPVVVLQGNVTLATQDQIWLLGVYRWESFQYICATVSDVCPGGQSCRRSARLLWDFYSNYHESCVNKCVLHINKITRTIIEFPGAYTARLGTHTLAGNDNWKGQLYYPELRAPPLEDLAYSCIIQKAYWFQLELCYDLFHLWGRCRETEYVQISSKLAADRWEWSQ